MQNEQLEDLPDEIVIKLESPQDVFLMLGMLKCCNPKHVPDSNDDIIARWLNALEKDITERGGVLKSRCGL